jgi:hypothetical protein
MNDKNDPPKIDEETRNKLQELKGDLEKMGVKFEISENLDETFRDIFLAYSKKAGDIQFQNNMKELEKKVGEELRSQKNFENRLQNRWKKPFDLLEFLIIQSTELGRYYNEKNRETAIKEQNFVFESLIQLHGWACLVAKEIMVLMKSGYADGANARWRTLNEIAVICFFIKKHGNEVGERYLSYQYIESCKAMREYQKYAERLGYVPFSKQEIENLKKVRENLVKKFGKNFTKNNGWAADVLNKESPKFFDLAEDIDLEHLYPFFKMASNAVHATSSKGLYVKLGSPQGKIIQAGPSNFGMADPGQNTAMSLIHINVALLTLNPGLDLKKDLEGLITTNSMFYQLHEINTAFIEVHNNMNPNQFWWE